MCLALAVIARDEYHKKTVTRTYESSSSPFYKYHYYLLWYKQSTIFFFEIKKPETSIFPDVHLFDIKRTCIARYNCCRRY